MTKGRDRVVCVPLSEDEWAALVQKYPDPVEWIRGQILAHLDGQDLPKPQAPVKAGPPSQPFSTRRA